jgi:hypothetical protein
MLYNILWLLVVVVVVMTEVLAAVEVDYFLDQLVIYHPVMSLVYLLLVAEPAVFSQLNLEALMDLIVILLLRYFQVLSL